MQFTISPTICPLNVKTCSRNVSFSIPAREALFRANHELSLDACSSGRWGTKLQEAIPWPSQEALLLKKLPAMQVDISGFDPWVRKIPWKGKMATTPVFLPEKVPWAEEPGGLQSMGLQSQTPLKRLSTRPLPDYNVLSCLCWWHPQLHSVKKGDSNDKV